MQQRIPALVPTVHVLGWWPRVEPFSLPSSLIPCRGGSLSKSQDMWQPLSFFQTLWAQNLMWSPPSYHWPWHHRIYTTSLPLKLGNCLLSRSLEEFAYWFWSCYLVTIQSVSRDPTSQTLPSAFSATQRGVILLGYMQAPFPSMPLLSTPFLVPDTIMLYQFNICKPLVMWLCQVRLIFLFI